LSYATLPCQNIHLKSCALLRGLNNDNIVRQRTAEMSYLQDTKMDMVPRQRRQNASAFFEFMKIVSTIKETIE
jgi:hypothetical protein